MTTATSIRQPIFVKTILSLYALELSSLVQSLATVSKFLENFRVCKCSAAANWKVGTANGPGTLKEIRIYTEARIITIIKTGLLALGASSVQFMNIYIAEESESSLPYPMSTGKC